MENKQLFLHFDNVSIFCEMLPGNAILFQRFGNVINVCNAVSVQVPASGL